MSHEQTPPTRRELYEASSEAEYFGPRELRRKSRKLGRLVTKAKSLDTEKESHGYDYKRLRQDAVHTQRMDQMLVDDGVASPRRLDRDDKRIERIDQKNVDKIGQIDSKHDAIAEKHKAIALDVAAAINPSFARTATPEPAPSAPAEIKPSILR